MEYFKEKRKSFIEIGNVYFWTATINNWIKLLEPDIVKQIIIDSLLYLSQKKKIEVYAFVIMPNHIHLIWKINEKNGLAFHLFKRETALQKLDYIHNNPLAEHWQLCTDPIKYYYSSARFYDTGVDDFKFLRHIIDVF
jgi:putative transposase